MNKHKIEYVPIGSLKPADYNPRKASQAQTEQLTESIKRYGLVDPIIVNSAPARKNIVIGGHFRLRVAKELDYKTVPVVYVNIPDIKKEQELNIRLNKNQAEWDFDLLCNFDKDLLKDIGFDSIELDKIFQTDKKEFESNKTPEIPEYLTFIVTPRQKKEIENRLDKQKGENRTEQLLCLIRQK